MKKLVSVILSLGLVVCILSTFSSTANAKTNVEQGFYLDHKMYVDLADFWKMSKKEKKAIVNEIIKSKSSFQLVLGDLVYDFKVIIGLPAEVEPTGTPLKDYNKEFISSPVAQELRILSIK